MQRQVFGAIGDPHVVAPLQRVDRAGQLGVAAALVMAEGLAVGRDHHDAARLDLRRRLGDRIREGAAILQAMAERDRSRKVVIKTKNRQAQDSERQMNGPAPRRSAPSPLKRPLVGRQDDKFYSGRGDVAQRIVIGRAFRQPHPSGGRLKRVTKSSMPQAICTARSRGRSSGRIEWL